MVNAPTTQPKPGSFEVPAPAVASHPDVILNPRDLRRLTESLPLANPVKAGNLLLHHLRLLTRDPRHYPKYGTLLELYHEPLRQLRSIVYERLPGNLDCAMPLDQLESLLVELLTELAYGYLRAANELLNAQKTPSVETLFHAMSLLDHALSVERLHYRRLSPRRWQLMLKLYLYAEQQQICDQPIDAKQHTEDEPDSIEALFFRALVMILCDPHNQTPKEVSAWHRWTADHAALLSLTVLPQGTFAIPIDISGERAPLTSARKSRPGPDTRYLAGDRFMQQLEDDDSAPAGLHRALIGLIKGRRTPEQRRAERQPRDHPYRLIHGMLNIHRRLDELTKGEVPSHDAATSVPCRQVNQSRFGSAFHLQGPISPPLGVGEVILAEAESSAGATAPVGFAARIRRAFSEDDRRIEIGVEKIQGRLIPVTILGAAAERSHGDKLALLQHDSDSGRYALLAARSVYREGDSVAVQGPSVRHNLRMLRLGGVVQNTAYIDVEPLDG
jgi:hypothetical protein